MVTILPPRESLNHHWLLLELHGLASSPTAWTTIACATLRSICGMSGVMPTCPFSSMLPARTGSSTVPTSVRSSSPRAPMYMSNGSFPTSVMLRPPARRSRTFFSLALLGRFAPAAGLAAGFAQEECGADAGLDTADDPFVDVVAHLVTHCCRP